VLDERVLVITGDRIGLADRLRAPGARVEALNEPCSSPELVRSAFAGIATQSPISAVIHACFPPAAMAGESLAGTTEAAWDARGEEPLRAALFVCQVAFAHLREHGGRIILLTPTAGLVGEPGFVPIATAAEGMRALAKSAARQWGAHGITVNCVAVPLELLGASVTPPVNPPALGRTATVDDVARAITALTSDGAAAITGATIPVDGGVVMLS
jgi:NAD(P)-dependent dehydrogenase (short-subunit alcohol dehydrogenase family)